MNSEEQKILKTNHDLYNALGNLYADGENDLAGLKKIGIWQDWLRELPGKKILDLGAGTGVFASELSEGGYNTTAIDIAESMIKEIKNKSSQVDAKLMNVLDIDQLKKQFDGISAIHLLRKNRLSTSNQRSNSGCLHLLAQMETRRHISTPRQSQLRNYQTRATN
jgi:2-polyprenyl-3-methyl-5-hydroxy-6-metoxy-1,4-benzoquinol methylase